MISRKEKIMWLFYGLILVILFLLSSTDLIIKDTRPEVYPISIIIEDVRDDNYVNYRKGMDQAAIEFNADVGFVTLYDSNSQDQQVNLMVREQQDGARALIVMPVDENVVEEALVEKRVTVPVVLVNSELPRDRISAVVSTDFYEMGQKLATNVVENTTEKLPVILVSGERENTMTRHFEEGVRGVLEEDGFSIERVSRQDDDTIRSMIEALVYPGSGKAIIVALDQSSLEEVSEILRDSTVYQEYVSGLYGRGTTVPILNYLDEGIITGICVTDDFNAGYLSVKRAVDAITNQLEPEQSIMENYYIEKADLRDPRYEKMLYPIE